MEKQPNISVLGVALAMRYGAIPPHKHDRELLNFFADQLMEARKCEAEVGGNTAKLREAVEAVLLAFNYGESMIVNQLPFSKLLPMLRKCVEALAKPSRNCDRFGGDIEKLREACLRERGLNPDEDFPEIFCEWLLAAITKGGAQ